jgi:hypothetical protein
VTRIVEQTDASAFDSVTKLPDGPTHLPPGDIDGLHDLETALLQGIGHVIGIVHRIDQGGKLVVGVSDHKGGSLLRGGMAWIGDSKRQYPTYQENPFYNRSHEANTPYRCGTDITD